MSAPFIFVTNFGSNSVSIIDVAILTSVTYVDNNGFVVGHPTHILGTPDGLNAYGVTESPDAVFFGSPAGAIVLGEVAPGIFPFGSPQSQVITPDSLKSYVTNNSINEVSIIDNTTETVTGYINFGAFPFSGPSDICMSTDGHKVYVVNNSSNTVSIIDVATNTVTGYVNPNGHPFSFPDRSIFIGDASTGKAYITNFNGNNVSIVDAATNTVTGYITINSMAGNFPFSAPHACTLSNDSSYALICNFTSGLVSVVDVATDTVTGYVAGGVLSQPQGISISLDGTLAFASNFNLNTVTIFDLTTNPFTIMGIVNPGLAPFNGPFDVATGIPSATPPPPLLPPSALTGSKAEDIFASQTDLIAHLTWQPSLSGNPVAYRIYRDAALQNLAGTVSANGPLQFNDHNRIPYTSVSYFVVAVNKNGAVSSPVRVIVNF